MDFMGQFRVTRSVRLSRSTRLLHVHGPLCTVVQHLRPFGFLTNPLGGARVVAIYPVQVYQAAGCFGVAYR